MTEIMPGIDKGDPSLAPSLGTVLKVIVCEHCHWRCLTVSNTDQPRCPNCRSCKVAVYPGGLKDMPYPSAPEMLLPFQLDTQALSDEIGRFSTGIPFAPAGLSRTAMLSHLEKVFLPTWLVDADVVARWEAETGYDYQVISHQDFFNQDANGWQSREVKEDRVRWENRVGRLQKAYPNIIAPAMDDHQRVEARLGPFRRESALAFQSEQTQDAWIRLPDLAPQGAWTEATGAFQNAAAEDCRMACGAGHLRQFRWQAEYANLNWTLMLLPVFSTYYLDDGGQVQRVQINGQTGKISGSRRASLKRAGRWGLIMLAVSLVTFLIGLLLDLILASAAPQITGISTLLLMLGFLGVFASAVPYLTAWDFNRKQEHELIDRKPPV